MKAFMSWAITQRTTDRVQVITNKCLQIIMNEHWPDIINNKELWRKKLNRNQFWTRHDEDSGLNLGTLTLKKVRWQHCKASSPVDATWPQMKRTTEKHLEERSRKGNVDSWRKMEAASQKGAVWMKSRPWPKFHREQQKVIINTHDRSTLTACAFRVRRFLCSVTLLVLRVVFD